MVHGVVFDVAVDIRPSSETYGHWYGITLSEHNHKQLYIPEGFAHGFEKTNLEIAMMILGRLGKPQDLIEYVKDRPGHDRRYAIDASKIRKELGWKPQYTFFEGIELTIDWYVKHGTWLERLE